MNYKASTILVFLSCSCFLHLTSPSELRGKKNTLWQGEKLNVGDRLVSDSGDLSLSFFKPANNSNNLYLGVNTLASKYYFWVAKRDTPIPANSRPALTIDEYGSLKIVYNGGGDPIVLYSSVEAPKNTSLFLPDTGNVELREMNLDGSKHGVLWQAVDYPTDTLFRGMKLGRSKRTGQTWSLTSWRSNYNPLSGSFTLGMDPNNTKQILVWWREKIVWTSGEWDHNERTFSNTKGLADFNNFTYISNENETYFEHLLNSNICIKSWGSICGIASGTCSACVTSDSPPFLAGCNMPKPPQCRRNLQYNGNDFVLPSWYGTGKMSMEGFKFDDSENLTYTDCWLKCLNDCSCVAYSHTNEDVTGCEIWSTTAKFILTKDGQQISFLYEKSKAPKSRRRLIVISVAGVAFAILISCYIFFVLWRKHKAKVNKKMKQLNLIQEIGGNATPPPAYDASKVRICSKDGKINHEMHIFSFESIDTATYNFSSANKLGQGGYGPVYKGKLKDGQEIAVKRLSQSSEQGLGEFKNEAQLIAKLQHRNLVRLLGFCIEKEERILVYEYMPNKSLDFYLFDFNKKKLLKWKSRFCIIENIAQALVYLHNYSRVTVIHRDLKASNILLDNEMSPKISDFGMARIFGSKGSEENTNRVVGTFGYMCPEYAMSGVVSIKTDVFSYGVLLLEIVSGKKNNSLIADSSLIAYAWQLWSEGRVSEIIDPILDGLIMFSSSEILRCIHIGLLCVQNKAADRPTMLDVVSFLSNETIQLPQPKQPAFFNNVVKEQQDDLPLNNGSLNDVTISEMDGR
ncbi:putative Receptor protein kinase [Quillaja saponaria]|uniref:Receptor-like serine/threonine-protein kinase n=1 Tax=Quillaja saponaria TaxID=32244 RepID=A0AAD7PE58_QUISA|nr:putative Receptor protein kinase [Quillaja saponaria]